MTFTLNDSPDGKYVVGPNRTLTITLVDVDAKKPASRSGYTRSGYVSACLDWLRAKYPSGKYWNHCVGMVNNDNCVTSTPCNPDTHTSSNVIRSTSWCNGSYGIYSGSTICNGNQSYNSAQCMGFALKVASDVFGRNPMGSGWTQYSYASAGGFQPGDYVRISGHSFFVTAVDSTYVYTLECNSSWNGVKYSCMIFRSGDGAVPYPGARTISSVSGSVEYIRRYTAW